MGITRHRRRVRPNWPVLTRLAGRRSRSPSTASDTRKPASRGEPARWRLAREPTPRCSQSRAPTGRSVVATYQPVWSAVEAAGAPELPRQGPAQRRRAANCFSRPSVSECRRSRTRTKASLAIAPGTPETVVQRVVARGEPAINDAVVDSTSPAYSDACSSPSGKGSVPARILSRMARWTGGVGRLTSWVGWLGGVVENRGVVVGDESCGCREDDGERGADPRFEESIVEADLELVGAVDAADQQHDERSAER